MTKLPRLPNPGNVLEARYTAKQMREYARKCLESQEPVAMRHSFDGYGYQYIDSGSGSDWRTRIEGAEPVFAGGQA